MLDELTSRGAVLSPGAGVAPGDILFLRDRLGSDPGVGRHVAIVDTVDGTVITSIDGNWGDSVQRVMRERASAEIIAIARWPQADD